MNARSNKPVRNAAHARCGNKAWQLRATVSALALMLGACATDMQADLSDSGMAGKEHLRAAAAQLDVLSEDLNRYGAISVASPGVVLSLGNRQPSDLNLSDADLLADPKAQGFSAARAQREIMFAIAARLALAGEGDAANALLNAALPSNSGEGGEAEGDDADDGVANSDDPQVDVPEMPAEEASRVAQAFTANLGVPSPGDLALTRRQRILLAKDDQLTQTVANFAAAPSADAFGAGKRLYAAVLSVTLRPGRQTYKDHVGEVEVHVQWAHRVDAKNDDGITVKDMDGDAPKAPVRLNGRYPKAFAVFPMLDSQVLDLRRSDRNLIALGAELEAAVPQASAAIRAGFRKLREADRGTLEARNTVVAYNASGRQIGWRFSPRFTAQGDPAENDPKPANQLFEQSFPALVFFVADLDDICKSHGGTGENKPCATHISVQSTSRWLSARPSGKRRWGFSGDKPSRLTEVQAVDWGVRLDEAIEEFNKAKGLGASRYGGGHAMRNFSARFNSMLDATIGADVFQELPEPKSKRPPQGVAISAVAPSHGWAEGDTFVVVKGRGFLQPQGAGGAMCAQPVMVRNQTGQPPQAKCATAFFVGGMKADVVTVTHDGSAVVLQVKQPPPGGNATALDITVVNAQSGTATLPAAITFDLAPPKAAPEKDKPDSQVVVKRNGSGKVSAIAVHGAAPDAVFEAIKPSSPGTPVVIDIDTNGPTAASGVAGAKSK